MRRWWSECSDLTIIVMFIAVFMLLLTALLSVVFVLDAHNCAHVCRRNGDNSDYLVGGECWCADEQGLYNPKDSREERGGRR